MDLTVICPTFNEIRFVDSLVRNLCADDGTSKEVIIADGGSTDGTRRRLSELQVIYPRLRVLDNLGRTSTKAFNLSFLSSSGKYVAFVGAHASYNSDYFRIALEHLDRDECDVAGGCLKQLGENDKGSGIALAMSSKLGVGNTEFRTRCEKKYTESVAFAVYKRSLIDRFGLMDESLPVNQDDEFHYRIHAGGARILMIPEMSCTYYVRSNYAGLNRQYFRYGLYKPLVLKKVNGSARLRHFVPALFTLYLLSLPFAAVFIYWLIPLLAYLLIVSGRAFKFPASGRIRLFALLAFPVLHLSYGMGFIIGFFRFRMLKSRTAEPLSDHSSPTASGNRTNPRLF